MPHPAQDQPEDRWSDESTPPADEVPRTARRQPRRRALRLAAAIGVIVGALCIVLGTLALVVEIGPQQAVAYGGPGDGPPKRIPISGDLYGIAWRFNCPPGHTGAFKIAESATGGIVDLNQSGSSMNGRWVDDHRGTHRAVFVISQCRWHASLFKPAPGASSSPGHGNKHKMLVNHAHKKHHGHKTHPHRKRHGRKPEASARHNGCTTAPARTARRCRERPRRFT